MSLGNKIFLLRTQQNISQEKLAEELNVSRQSISKWETDQSIPELDKIQMLCKYFNITVDSLLSEDMETETIDNKTSNKSNMMKRVASIILKTGVYTAVLYFILILLFIVCQRGLWEVYYRNIEFHFVFPTLLVTYELLYVITYFIFCKKIMQKIKSNNRTIMWEIIGLVVLCILFPVLNSVKQLIEIYMFKLNPSVLANYSLLRNNIFKLIYFYSIPNILFIIGVSISLTARTIDSSSYLMPEIEQNETISSGFSVLAFFMGFLGGAVIWILSFVLIKDWKYDKPIRSKQFKKIFIMGLICGMFLKMILIFINLVSKNLI